MIHDLYTPEGAQLHTNAVLKALGNALETEFKEFTINDYEAVKGVIGQ